jgi:hypothetical protein
MPSAASFAEWAGLFVGVAVALSILAWLIQGIGSGDWNPLRLARRVLSGLKSRRSRSFYLVLLSMAVMIGAALQWGDVIFTAIYPSATAPDQAKAPLAVFGAASVIAIVSAVNFCRISTEAKAFDVAVPDSWRSWLPGVAAVLVGGLIGTTIFR